MASTVVLLQHGTKSRSLSDPGLTEEGREQVRLAAEVLAAAGPKSLVSSPRARALESVEPLSAATGLGVVVDDRVRERMEFSSDTWDSVTEFLQDWEHASQDRDFTPTVGDSSRQAAARLLSAVIDHGKRAAFVVIATHGGVTVDFLRTVAARLAVPQLLRDGMPNGHLTTCVVEGDHVEVIEVGVDPRHWAPPAAS